MSVEDERDITFVQGLEAKITNVIDHNRFVRPSLPLPSYMHVWKCVVEVLLFDGNTFAPCIVPEDQFNNHILGGCICAQCHLNGAKSLVILGGCHEPAAMRGVLFVARDFLATDANAIGTWSMA